MAASFTCSGVSKSGSPAVKDRTSIPCARRARARAARASVGEGVKRRARSASIRRITPLGLSVGAGGRKSAALQLRPEPMLDAGRDQALHRAPVAGDFLDQAGRDV